MSLPVSGSTAVVPVVPVGPAPELDTSPPSVSAGASSPQPIQPIAQTKTPQRIPRMSPRVCEKPAHRMPELEFEGSRKPPRVDPCP